MSEILHKQSIIDVETLGSITGVLEALKFGYYTSASAIERIKQLMEQRYKAQQKLYEEYLSNSNNQSSPD